MNQPRAKVLAVISVIVVAEFSVRVQRRGKVNPRAPTPPAAAAIPRPGDSEPPIGGEAGSSSRRGGGGATTESSERGD